MTPQQMRIGNDLSFGFNSSLRLSGHVSQTHRYLFLPARPTLLQEPPKPHVSLVPGEPREWIGLKLKVRPGGNTPGRKVFSEHIKGTWK